MKKLFVLCLLLASSTGCGCGRSFFPRLFRGAPCNGLCSAPAAGAHGDCENCAPSEHAGYGSYDSGIVQGGEVYGSEYVQGNQYVQPGSMVPSYAAPMSAIPGTVKP